MQNSAPYIPPHEERIVRAGTMFMFVLRAAFVLGLSAVGWSLASDTRNVSGWLAGQGDLIVIGFAGAACIVIALDLFIPRKSLTAISGLFFARAMTRSIFSGVTTGEVMRTLPMPASISTSASLTFAAQTPLAPRSSCFFAMTGHLCVFA